MIAWLLAAALLLVVVGGVVARVGPGGVTVGGPGSFRALGDQAAGVPALGPSAVYVPTAAGIAAVDRDTGSVRWTTEVCPLPTWPDPTRRVGDPVLVVRCDGKLAGVDAADGRVRWMAPVGDPDYIRGSADLLALGYGDRVDLFDPTTGSRRWSHRTDAGGLHPVAVRTGLVLAADGQDLVALDAADGAVRWTAPVDVGAMHLADDVLYVRTYDHALVGVELATGEVLWQVPPQHERLLHTVILGVTANVMVLKNETTTVAVHVPDGRVAWARSPAVGTTAAGVAALADERSIVVVDAATGTARVLDEGEFDGAPALDDRSVAWVSGGTLVVQPRPT